MEKNELVSYAMDFASYLVSKLQGIERIILHGSVARGDFDEDSDIDLFIDANERIKERVYKILDDYQKTDRHKEWQLKGIENDFSIIVGLLDSKEWKDLKRAIINTGLILFGKYKAEIEKVHQYTLFSFENIKPDKKRVAVFRKLFGFKVGKKYYEGLVIKYKGIRLGKGIVLIPVEHSKDLKDYLKEKGITPKIIDFWSDTEF